MKICADLHTHTLASGHAHSTLKEMAIQAKQMGYEALAITDHAKSLPGSPPKYYFSNLTRLPDIIEDGLVLLKGVEGNLLGDGTIDVPEALHPRLDWFIVSLHGVLVDDLSLDRATELWLQVAENPYVDMIGHSEQQNFRYDYEYVTKVFAQKNKVVEMNAASATSRPGNEGNMRELALACMKNGTRIAVNSDAHSIYRMDSLGHVLAMLEEIGFPEELVVNSSMERLMAELKRHGKPIAERLAHLYNEE